ncbi:hypothetical protein [Bacteroides sp.]|uniref:hypothetical protein n=1 Tax=Bacteroides sp. TaxID=29523 RepID=UPI002624308B|nr:hypothetical protein [Bacteroides sp.]MDD3038976.1 hypothetical protein [Bacteroides sp.]
MIRFGYHSAPDKAISLPKMRVLDYVMEYTVIFVFVVTGILTLFYYSQLSGKSLTECWTNAGLIVLLVGSYLFVRRVSIQFYRFPVHITERNVYVQFFLASRAIRVILMMVLFMEFFLQLELFAVNIWNIGKDIFFILITCALVGLIVTLIVYYILAIRYRN